MIFFCKTLWNLKNVKIEKKEPGSGVCWDGDIALSLGIYSVPFRVSKPRDPRVQFPPAGEAAKATFKAKEAEEQGRLAGIFIHTNKILYHERLRWRWKRGNGGGEGTSLLSAPVASPRLFGHLFFCSLSWTKLTAAPQHLHAGSASAPLYRMGFGVQYSPALGLPSGLVVGNPPTNAGDTGSIPGPGRSHMLQSN